MGYKVKVIMRVRVGFDFGQLAHVAEELSKFKSESFHRSAVSRAFYVAFHACRDHIHFTNPGLRGIDKRDVSNLRKYKKIIGRRWKFEGSTPNQNFF
jgi:hypothetical protein